MAISYTHIRMGLGDCQRISVLMNIRCDTSHVLLSIMADIPYYFIHDATQTKCGVHRRLVQTPPNPTFARRVASVLFAF